MGLSIPAGVFLSTDSLSEIADAMVYVPGDGVSGHPDVERSFVMAETAGHGHGASVQEQGHHHALVGGDLWEGSQKGIAYSEFNHHIAGIFLLLIGMSEVRQALGWPALV